jgi:DNA-directed RNA polymerase beta subunit
MVFYYKRYRACYCCSTYSFLRCFIAAEEVKGKEYYGAKIIPARGVWIELQTTNDNEIIVRIDKKENFNCTLLRAFGFKSNEDIWQHSQLIKSRAYIKKLSRNR